MRIEDVHALEQILQEVGDSGKVYVIEFYHTIDKVNTDNRIMPLMAGIILSFFSLTTGGGKKNFLHFLKDFAVGFFGGILYSKIVSTSIEKLEELLSLNPGAQEIIKKYDPEIMEKVFRYLGKKSKVS